MPDIAIRARGLSKRYSVFGSQGSRFMHAVMPSWRRGISEVWALRDVNLEVRRGEPIAVIGRNGGGKSTLLQLLTGTMVPTSGEIEVKGRVSALLELGSGFNPEYTGRDNVMMNGLILGLPRAEIERRFGEIAAFADIGEAIERPVKTYSSGMLMRLAFAVQVLTDPEILIVDEALSVGDFFFQQKCLAYIRSLCERGVTLVFVSHDMGTVRDLCSRTLYLRDGRVLFDGETRLAIREYMSERANGVVLPQAGTRAPAQSRSPELDELLRDSVWRAGGELTEGRLIAVAFYDESGEPSTTFRLGSTLRIRAAYRPSLDGATHVAIAIWNKFNQVVTSVGSSSLGVTPPDGAGSTLIFEMTLGLVLEAGNYSIMVSLNRLTRPNRADNLDSTPQLGPFVVQWDYEQANAPFLGMVGLPAKARFTRAAPEGEAA